MNYKKITRNYRIGLLISAASIIVAALFLWIKPLPWTLAVQGMGLYIIGLSFPVVQFLVVLGLQFEDLYYRRKYVKAETEEKQAQIASSNRLGSYVVIFLSVEFFFTWAGIFYKVMPAAMELDNGDAGNFLNALFKLLAVLLSVMYIFLGNYIPISRGKGQGFTCKWSDYNENTKLKSNRYAGKVFVAAGFISTVISIIFNGYIGMGAMFVALFAALAISSKKSKEYFLEERCKDEAS